VLTQENVEDRRKGLKKIISEYRVCITDTEKAIKEWSREVAAENTARADGYMHVLNNPNDELGEARHDAAEAAHRVRRMEAEVKMKERMLAENDARKALDKALRSFAEAAASMEARA
jgi:predicted methyltransferase